MYNIDRSDDCILEAHSSMAIIKRGYIYTYVCTEQPPSRLAIFGNDNLCLQEAYIYQYVSIYTIVGPAGIVHKCMRLDAGQEEQTRWLLTMHVHSMLHNGHRKWIHIYRSIYIYINIRAHLGCASRLTPYMRGSTCICI